MEKALTAPVGTIRHRSLLITGLIRYRADRHGIKQIQSRRAGQI
ncbi:hypothetical protein [Geobacillus sp. C56-T2]|nr:hypothetical protein [Geobacillus sp. C56-T2]